MKSATRIVWDAAGSPQPCDTAGEPIVPVRGAASRCARCGDDRAVNGLDYRRKSGLRICTPLGDWRGIDVFSYLLSQEIEPLHVYRCIGFMHQRDPSRIRKSWWIPGDMGKYGGATWLRRYYPSLFQRLLEWFPRARSFA